MFCVAVQLLVLRHGTCAPPPLRFEDESADTDTSCRAWAQMGECESETQRDWMLANCPHSCAKQQDVASHLSLESMGFDQVSTGHHHILS